MLPGSVTAGFAVWIARLETPEKEDEKKKKAWYTRKIALVAVGAWVAVLFSAGADLSKWRDDAAKDIAANKEAASNKSRLAEIGRSTEKLNEIQNSILKIGRSSLQSIKTADEGVDRANSQLKAVSANTVDSLKAANVQEVRLSNLAKTAVRISARSDSILASTGELQSKTAKALIIDNKLIESGLESQMLQVQAAIGLNRLLYPLKAITCAGQLSFRTDKAPLKSYVDSIVSKAEAYIRSQKPKPLSSESLFGDSISQYALPDIRPGAKTSGCIALYNEKHQTLVGLSFTPGSWMPNNLERDEAAAANLISSFTIYLNFFHKNSLLMELTVGVPDQGGPSTRVPLDAPRFSVRLDLETKVLTVDFKSSLMNRIDAGSTISVTELDGCDVDVSSDKASVDAPYAIPQFGSALTLYTDSAAFPLARLQDIRRSIMGYAGKMAVGSINHFTGAWERSRIHAQ